MPPPGSKAQVLPAFLVPEGPGPGDSRPGRGVSWCPREQPSSTQQPAHGPQGGKGVVQPLGPTEQGRAMRTALTCPACGIGAAALVRPLQGGQPRQELGARSRLGPGEVCALGVRVSSPSRAKGSGGTATGGSRSCPRRGRGGAADSPQGRGLGGQAQAQVGGRRRD